MKNLVIFCEKLLTKTYSRNIAYIVLTILLLILANLFKGSNFIDSSLEEIILTANNLLIFLLPAIVIDAISPHRKWFSSGINIDRFALRDFFIGMFFGIGGIGLLALVGLFFGAEVVIVEIDIRKFLKSTFWIFNDATVEELIFRGFIFQNIFRKNNSNFIILFSSLLFAFLHFLAQPFVLILFINTFLAGILFCLMYVKTKSLWLPISFHFFWNWTMFNIFNRTLDITSVLDFGSHTVVNFIFFTVETELIHLFFGYNSGFESGLLCSILLILLMVVTVTKIKPSYRINAQWFKEEYCNKC